MSKKKTASRRSFFVDLASSAAGLLLVVGGIGALSGCEMAADYGGPAPVDMGPDSPIAKYGGPDSMAPDDGGPDALAELG